MTRLPWHETGNAADGGENHERERHGPGLVVGSVMTFGHFMFLPPEDEVVEAEHIEGGQTGHERHPEIPESGVAHRGRQDFILREESGEGDDARDSQTADEEGDMGNWHVFAETVHLGVVV